MKSTCDMCLAPLKTPEQTVTKGQFCEFCCQEGRLLYASDDIYTFRRRVFDKMYAEGANEFVARFHTLLIGEAPYWKKRRS